MDYNEAELGKNYEYKSISPSYKEVKLINENVKIVIVITPRIIDLEAFYNLKRKPRIARCSLLWLLKKLLSDNLITEEDDIEVSSPVPNDGNLGKLIGIYEDIGFYYEDDILTSLVGHLIKTLEKYCAITTVQCAGGSSLRF
tara:strand:- start:160 stop:585 length:426 start_codon:yes stop_codon:yes gene_type:complete